MAEPFIEECLAVLTRTPAALDGLLRGLPEGWTDATEGPGTWSPYMVIGHLARNERNNWIPRVTAILADGASRPFPAGDRVVEENSKSLGEWLDEFAALRRENVAKVRELRLTAAELQREGLHPTLGRVTLRQLLATWTAHDLAHTVQISRVMAKRYRGEVGPFAEFLSVMR
jgi:hypothetical protein